MSEFTFPIQAIPPNWKTWLLEKNSFIERLKQFSSLSPHIDLLSQTWEIPLDEEKKALSLAIQQECFIREVTIKSNQTSWMFARSVFPISLLKETEGLFSHLGQRSLGSVLFKDPSLKRSDFTYALLEPQTYWHQKATQGDYQTVEKLWARRSIFEIKAGSLLLTEVFFPTLLKLSEQAA